MAVSSTSRLVCKFNDADGEKVSKSFNYANPEVTDAQAKALMNACINYGADVFERVPAEIVSSQLVTTTTKDLEVSD